MNNSSCNGDFWVSLEGYAGAYYWVLHEIYCLPPFVGEKSSLCMLTRHFNQGYFPLFIWKKLVTVGLTNAGKKWIAFAQWMQLVA